MSLTLEHSSITSSADKLLRRVKRLIKESREENVGVIYVSQPVVLKGFKEMKSKPIMIMSIWMEFKTNHVICPALLIASSFEPKGVTYMFKQNDLEFFVQFLPDV